MHMTILPRPPCTVAKQQPNRWMHKGSTRGTNVSLEAQEGMGMPWQHVQALGHRSSMMPWCLRPSQLNMAMGNGVHVMLPDL